LKLSAINIYVYVTFCHNWGICHSCIAIFGLYVVMLCHVMLCHVMFELNIITFELNIYHVWGAVKLYIAVFPGKLPYTWVISSLLQKWSFLLKFKSQKFVADVADG